MAARRSLGGGRRKIKEAWEISPKPSGVSVPESQEKRPICKEAATIMSKNGITSNSFDFGSMNDETQVMVAKGLVFINSDEILDSKDKPPNKAD